MFSINFFSDKSADHNNFHLVGLSELDLNEFCWNRLYYNTYDRCVNM